MCQGKRSAASCARALHGASTHRYATAAAAGGYRGHACAGRYGARASVDCARGGDGHAQRFRVTLYERFSVRTRALQRPISKVRVPLRRAGRLRCRRVVQCGHRLVLAGRSASINGNADPACLPDEAVRYLVLRITFAPSERRSTENR